MIQREFRDVIFEFVKQASGVEDVVSIVLFGSVARGDATPASDIDILVVVSTLDIENQMSRISHDLGDKFDKRLQVLVKTSGLEDLDNSTIEEIGKEGILLYGKPIILKAKNLNLKPHCIVMYSLTTLQQSEKMRFRRAMFGSKSTCKRNGKEYTTIQKGILEQINGASLGRGAIIIPSNAISTVEGAIKRFGVTYKIFLIWSDEELTSWIRLYLKGRNLGG